MENITYTLEQSYAVQKALREAANLPPESFEVEEVVGMLSDEIGTLRDQGKSDEEIAGIMTKAGMDVTADEIAEFYQEDYGDEEE